MTAIIVSFLGIFGGIAGIQVAALITPTPDVVNLCLFALPTIGLYLLGVGAAALFPRRRGSGGDPD